ncbi:hypothetical protein [Yoonia sp. R2-816]|uniref:hypothetical protein n=1 Tax=Yoonia sp. R2-816 TaxID=3342638 RepID=UPI0037284BBD
MPRSVLNPDNTTPTLSFPTPVSDLEQMGDVDKNAVFTVIIDDFVSLSHENFRCKPTKEGAPQTRILAAWSQGAQFDRSGQHPFGQMLWRAEIEKAMAQAQRGGTIDPLDFAKEVERLRPPSHQIDDGLPAVHVNVLRHVSHGTHVLDLAAGLDPAVTSDDALKLRPIIAVSLPNRESIGMAGTFLELFVVLAMRQVIKVTRDLWRHLYPADPEGGFDVVFNLSYGQQSGTKTASSLIEQEFEALADQRKSHAQTRLVMPVGNDNLARANARWDLGSETQLTIPWRVLPQDQSDNFVEIWVNLASDEMTTENPGAPLLVSLTPPDYDEPTPFEKAEDGLIFDYKEHIARIYCDVVDVPPAINNRKSVPLRRLRYVIAVLPTYDPTGQGSTAPCGAWKISIGWRGADLNPKSGSREVYMGVQVDQEPDSNVQINHRSYFDNHTYRTHLPNGRMMDTYGYEVDPNAETPYKDEPYLQDNARIFGAVQRKGTQNALANAKDILRIAGHRASDGRPAPFSASYYSADRAPVSNGRPLGLTPTASYPVDRSPAQRGVLAAGTQSRSGVALRGTSFAAPQACRWVVDQLIEAKANPSADLSVVGTSPALEEVAAAYEDPEGIGIDRLDKLKVGAGRLPAYGPHRTWSVSS